MICAIIQARMTSTRLPGKVLKPLAGEPMLKRQIERVRQSLRLDKVLVATSSLGLDEPIAELCRQSDTICFRGSLDDVLDRFYQAACSVQPDHVVRITGDCPVIDPEIIDRVVEFHLAGEYDYSSNALRPTFPDGLDVEVFTFDALHQAWKAAKLPSEREHVTPYIITRSDIFRLGPFENETDQSALRWTVDEPADYALIAFIYDALYKANPRFRFQDVLNLMQEHPERSKSNQKHLRNEGLAKSLLDDSAYLAKR